MLQMIHCTQCNETGSFDIHIEFTPETEFCEHCRHAERRTWSYYFCTRACMFKWLKEKHVEKEGFPCRDCHSVSTGEATGFAFGFKENGVCKTCRGKKCIKQAK